MDLLYGVSLILLLLPFTLFLIKLMDVLKTDWWMSIVGIMLFGDAILTFLWVYSFLHQVEVREPFVAGMGIAFFINMIFKIYGVLKTSQRLMV